MSSLPQREWSPAERRVLIAVAVFGLVFVNSAFGWGLLFREGALAAVMSNPIAMAFVVEAFVMMGVLAWLFERWGVSRLSWRWFVGLSLLGSMAFAVPVMLLCPRRGDGGG